MRMKAVPCLWKAGCWASEPRTRVRKISRGWIGKVQLRSLELVLKVTAF